MENKTMNLIRRPSMMLGLAVMGLGLVLGGCNNKLKQEHETLTQENAELRERLSSVDTEKATVSQQLTSLQSDNSRLQSELAAARTAPPVTAAPAPVFNDGPVSRPAGPRGGNSTIEISSDVLFTSGSATLKTEARRELDKYLSRFRSAQSITIEGHTDSDPLVKTKARWGSNQGLSKARADAVRDYLVSKGISRSKIDTVGKGSSEPRRTKKDSRRVDIVVAE